MGPVLLLKLECFNIMLCYVITVHVKALHASWILKIFKHKPKNMSTCNEFSKNVVFKLFIY